MSLNEMQRNKVDTLVSGGMSYDNAVEKVKNQAAVAAAKKVIDRQSDVVVYKRKPKVKDIKIDISDLDKKEKELIAKGKSPKSIAILKRQIINRRKLSQLKGEK